MRDAGGCSRSESVVRRGGEELLQGDSAPADEEHLVCGELVSEGVQTWQCGTPPAGLDFQCDDLVAAMEDEIDLLVLVGPVCRVCEPVRRAAHACRRGLRARHGGQALHTSARNRPWMRCRAWITQQTA